MNKTAEQEAQEMFPENFTMHKLNISEVARQAYIAGSTARSNEAKDAIDLLTRAQELIDHLEYPKNLCIEWAFLYDDINNFLKPKHP